MAEKADNYNYQLEPSFSKIVKKDELEHSRTGSCFNCGTWSQNPETPNWSVHLQLNCENPGDLGSCIGFIVLSNLETKNEKAQKLQIFKIHSRHDVLDKTIFTQLLGRGTVFTKIELDNGFFNNAYLVPGNITPTTKIETLSVPHLKTLIIKTKPGLVLKGSDQETQDAYYKLHLDHCNGTKLRASKNLWYLIKLFNCPNLSVFEIEDGMDWEDKDLKENGFYYWNQPLFDFLQRHATNLKTFKVTPLTIMQNEKLANVRSNGTYPCLEDLLFWMKLHLCQLDTKPEDQRELHFNREMDKELRPWREFLQAQANLKTMAWITDIFNPWNFTRQDFIHICQDNPNIESMTVALHGDKKFRQLNKIMESTPSCFKDFQIDAAVVHGVTALKALSIGCFNTDPQRKYFCIFNLHLLPRTLENVHLFGIRVMSADIEHLANLPRLKSLSVVQSSQIMYSKSDEINKNVEDITAGVLKKLAFARTLEQLTVVGFPFLEENQSNGKTHRAQYGLPSAIGWFGTICGGMCFPDIRESDHILNEKNDESTNGCQATLDNYVEPLKDILIQFAAFADVKDVPVEGEDNQIMTLLRVGDFANE